MPNHLGSRPDAIVLSTGLLHGNGSPLKKVVALKVKLTILESVCANRAWTCSTREARLPEDPFAARRCSGGLSCRAKFRCGEAETEYDRCLAGAAIRGTSWWW
jgi:hypothetical protein